MRSPYAIKKKSDKIKIDLAILRIKERVQVGGLKTYQIQRRRKLIIEHNLIRWILSEGKTI